MADTAHSLRLAYYGDDFTGSTDALEQLSRAGLKTVLFLDPPTPAQLARYPGLQAIGVAGLTRALAPAAMEATLRPAFAALRELGARHVHYKVCSTFDSAPHVGSIGCALEVGAAVFEAPFVPVLAATPTLGRYCLFGNLFARFGIGSAGAIHRLDRHPAISRHPVTPMNEADLALHLGKQTAAKIGLIDVLTIERGVAAITESVRSLVQTGHTALLFDALTPEHLSEIGAAFDGFTTPGKSLFSIGSSGVETALGMYWAARGEIMPSPTFPDPGSAAPLLVLSGSCSPVTAGQIEWALAHDFIGIKFDPATEISALLTDVTAALKSGRHTIVYTSLGEKDSAPVSADQLGAKLGALARAAIETTGIRRLVIAGGDTSSYTGRALGLESLEMIAPLAPGAPLCRSHAPGSSADGIEINFKGGQVGAPDYFGAVARGKI
ncbi:four-carbon acid sugar kinase family protein [Oleiharenicola lentus]|uniref:four-carbon acid sugar kinase family protein n=1 Tax=Oleiharenicola lentus TaxID=2508720 RepID=UPI003F680E1E